jgi:hypothetical protein
MWVSSAFHGLQRLRKLNLLILTASIGFYTYLVLGRFGIYFDDDFLRLITCLLFTLGGALLLRAAGFQNPWWQILGASMTFIALGYRIALYTQDVSTYPFSLNWSETSRYYYASLFFSERLYGFSIPPSVLHPSRYLMQALPFLLPDTQLWLHRLWQVVLWVTTTAVSSGFLARRLAISDRLKNWMFIAWSFVFMLLGPVYYHLQVMLILVLWLYDRRKPWRTLGVLLLASLWAGISRINWFPVPGMLVSALYFLEEALARRPLWRYLAPPVLWTALGTATAFGAQAGYALLSGNPPDHFTTSFTSDLLWYRLLPNTTFTWGVIFGALLLITSPVVLIAVKMGRRWNQLHPIRLFGLGSILLVLLAGGLVVSVKIGGGSNLHNLDAFLSLLLIVGGFFYFDRFAAETTPEIEKVPEQTSPVLLQWITAAFLGLTLIIPIYRTIQFGEPSAHLDRSATAQSLERLARFVRETTEDGGEVLFISERHLLTFNTIQGVRLVPDYEKVFLMEMAMANDTEYLKRFWNDLKNHRYGLIITEPLFVNYKGRSESFGEENDAWVKNVAEPVLCYYEQYRMLRDVRLQILEPQKGNNNCP